MGTGGLELCVVFFGQYHLERLCSYGLCCCCASLERLVLVLSSGSILHAINLAKSLCLPWMGSVGIMQHAYYLYLFVRAQATVPKCHPSQSEPNPHPQLTSQVSEFLYEFEPFDVLSQNGMECQCGWIRTDSTRREE